MKNFQVWKLDLMEAWAAMYLPIADYQSTVNHLIVNRLDSDIQATVVNLLSKSEEEFVTQRPEELLQQIEERLESMNLEEHRRLPFNLAKQRVEEDLERYKDQLHKYYEETLLQDKQKFVEKYINGVYNKVVEELLRTQKPP